jgi:hypothetical protein
VPDLDPVAQAIDQFRPRAASAAVATFAKELAASACPRSVTRAKAFLFAGSKLGVFLETVGVALDLDLATHPSVIERCCTSEVLVLSGPTRRTLRTNLRAIARARSCAPVPAPLSRERAKRPYSRAEIASYLALADAQPTEARRQRAAGLVCLGGGAGLVGQDLKAVVGTDVVVRAGGIVVEVTAGRHPRTVPVLSSYHDRLRAAARFAGPNPVIGGASPTRRNATTPLTASLAGGGDLPRIEVARLRVTWLCEVAETIGLRAFMDAAGITCSQRLFDLVPRLRAVELDEAVTLLGARR